MFTQEVRFRLFGCYYATMTALNEIVEYTDNLLQVSQYKDYCPNGLQIEGSAKVKKIISGVTASQALLDEAVTANADLVLVHHGYFWQGENSTITGMRKRRINTLLSNDISLLAYHLPLDAHPQHGNNAGLASKLGLEATGTLNKEGIGQVGKLKASSSAEEFTAHIKQVLGREPTLISGGDRPIQSVAWCTGAAQSYFEQAIEKGVDAYISGEISEQTVHLARECGVHYIAAGHHATERYGVQLLGQHLVEKFGLEHQFIDIDNPI